MGSLKSSPFTENVRSVRKLFPIGSIVIPCNAPLNDPPFTKLYKVLRIIRLGRRHPVSEIRLLCVPLTSETTAEKASEASDCRSFAWIEVNAATPDSVLSAIASARRNICDLAAKRFRMLENLQSQVMLSINKNKKGMTWKQTPPRLPST